MSVYFQPNQQRAGNQANAKSARHVLAGKTYMVCFAYNKKTGCRNATKGCGCDIGNGVIFAHVCNYWDRTANKFCLAAHVRENSH